MSSIDERIVQMRFENSQFQQGIKTTTDSLSALKDKLNFESAKTALTGLGQNIKTVSFDTLHSGLDTITAKFSAFASAASVALGNIASQAIQTGLTVVKSLTVAPIMQGYQDYEAKLTSIQTIAASTGKAIKDIEPYFNSLDTYADKTIYNLSDMTGALAKFVNAGVELDTAIPAIKGISNMTALAGQSAGAAGIAYYNLSQSISGGFLTTIDYKSLNLANIATKEWKTQMIDAAVAAGTLKKGANGIYNIPGSDKAYNDARLFTEGLSEQWATTDVLLKVLGDYGDTTTAIGAKAQASAQDVKSMSMMMETLKAAVGTGWTDTFQILIGDLDEAKQLWTGLTTAIQGYLDAGTDARNNLLQGWKDLGGRTELLDGLKNAAKALISFLKPIGDAFAEIFPPTTAKQLFDATKAFSDFTSKLILSAKGSEDLKNTFKGLFAIVDIVWTVFKGVLSVIGKLIGAVGGASGSVFSFTGGIGEFIVAIRDAIKSGDGLLNFFNFLGDLIKKPIEMIAQLGDALTKNVPSADGFAGVWERIVAVFETIWTNIKPVVDWFTGVLSVIGKALADTFKSMDVNSLLLLLNAGLIGGASILLKKVIGVFKKGFAGLGGGIFENIKDAFSQLTGSLKAMQDKIKAETLIRIAAAVGILVAAILILSFIDIDKLAVSLGAITVMFVELGAMLYVIEKMSAQTKPIKIVAMAVALILLATALTIMAAAITIMSKLTWDELGRGLVGMAGAIILLSGAANILSKSTGKMISAGIGILVLSTALLVLANAMKAFGSLSWEEMGKGLIVIGVLLALINRFSKSMGKIGGLISSSVALVLIAGSMMILANAMKAFGSLSWEEIGKGLTALAGSLVILSIALILMTDTVSGAMAMIIASVALTILANALKSMGSMSWDEIGKGLVLLASSLALIAFALILMEESIPGAAALLLAAAALAIIAPVLVLLGSMSWEAIGKGLVGLAAALVIIAGAGYLLIGGVVGLIGLGVAALLIGMAAMAAGTGILMMAAGITALAAASSIGAAAITNLAGQFIDLIPTLFKKIAEGIVEMAKVIADSATEFIDAFTVVLTALITALKNVAPLLIKTLFDIIMLIVKELEDNVPKFVDAGMNMITGILDGISKRLPALIKKAGDVIVAYIKGLGEQLPRIVKQGIKTVIAFIDGIADGVEQNSTKFVKAGSKLFRAIIDGIAKAISQGGADIRYAGAKIGEALLEGAKNFLGIHSPSREFYKVGTFATEGLVDGMSASSKLATKAGENVGYSALDGLNRSISDISKISLDNIDMNPTIRPVLDLSNIKRGSSEISALINPSAISVDQAYVSAASISATRQLSRTEAEAVQQISNQTGDTNITFTQNNNSPVALSATEIYRQTKNQISNARNMLAV